MNEVVKMFDVILDRKEHVEPGSYTNYLLDQGVSKICKKIGEESTEVVIAACMQSNEELVGEINDLLYHVLVLMAAKGISLDDIQAEMKKRALKEHNLKPQRKPIEKL